jgi:acyl-CoA synthetase (NDP forming)
VQGLRAYPTLGDIDGDVDFVLVAVPAPMVAGQVRAAAEKKARTVMVFSSGFAETGAEGTAMQDEVTAIARETGVRVIGPNCLGAFNAETRFYPTFTSTIDRATPQPGGISIASQSGAYGSHIYMASHMRGLGIRYWLTTGNEADVHVAEVIKLLAEHDAGRGAGGGASQPHAGDLHEGRALRGWGAGCQFAHRLAGGRGCGL